MQTAILSPTVQDCMPVPFERIEKLAYIAYEYNLQEVATRLKRHNYRGAICGPAGSGKSVMLQALGDELMDHGLTPLPLILNPDRTSALPQDWRRKIRNARHTDALLLDGYDLLPLWARVWVSLASMRAGAVIVTSQKQMRFKTLAHLKPTVTLLRQLVDKLQSNASDTVDCDAIFKSCGGNLRAALLLTCQHLAMMEQRKIQSKKNAV